MSGADSLLTPAKLGAEFALTVDLVSVSELEPFIRIAITFDTHRDEIANAIALAITNARLEGMNSTVRLLSHRARGFRRLESLLAMITLVCGRIPVALPT